MRVIFYERIYNCRSFLLVINKKYSFKKVLILHQIFLLHSDRLLKLDIEIIHIQAVMRIKAIPAGVELLPLLYEDLSNEIGC